MPVDLVADMARERGLTVDQRGFEDLMTAERERARAQLRRTHRCRAALPRRTRLGAIPQPEGSGGLHLDRGRRVDGATRFLGCGRRNGRDAPALAGRRVAGRALSGFLAVEEHPCAHR